ncbi:MAG: hypothetical protein KDJ47_16245 [Hyphomicrobiaceae bacterium]|nr:hypothetical protein [Hyphomicrobiaceae bacterium]
MRMKIIENTHQRLVIVERPWFLAAMLVFFAGFFAYATAVNWDQMPTLARIGFSVVPLAALMLLFATVRWVHVEFDRTLGRVTISRSAMWWGQRKQYALKDLEDVRADEDGEGGSYRVVLSFSNDILARMDRKEHERLERRWQRGFRTIPPTDVALTAYYASNIDGPRISAEIRSWTGLIHNSKAA